jgi:hypothetical protein
LASTQSTGNEPSEGQNGRMPLFDSEMARDSFWSLPATTLAALLGRLTSGHDRVSAGHSTRRDVAVGRSQSHPSRCAAGHPTGAARGEAHAAPAFEQTRARGEWGLGCSSCCRQVAATWLAIRAAVVISLSGDLTRSWKFQSMFQFGAIFLLGCCSCSSI